MDSTIRWLEEVDEADIDRVGMQAASLGELINAHVTVPYGFVIPKYAFEQFCREHAIGTLFASGSPDDILHLLAALPITHENMSSYAHAYHELQKRAHHFIPQKPLSTMHPFTGLYRMSSVQLSVSCADPHSFVNNIPSTTLVGENALLHAVRAVWIQVIRTYLSKKTEGGYEKMIHDAPSIIVQQVLKPQFSGSASLDSLNKNILIISPQDSSEKYHVFLPTGDLRETPTHGNIRGSHLSNEMIQAVAHQYKRIQKLRYLPFTISWVIHEDLPYIVSVEDAHKPVESESEARPDPSRHILLRGTPVLPGSAMGPVHIVSVGSVPKPGSILVSKNPLALSHDMIKHAAAIIFEEDDAGIDHFKGHLPHSMPVIKGIHHAGPVLKHEHMITIDGTRAEVSRVNHYAQRDSHHHHEPKPHHDGVQMYGWVESLQDLSRAIAAPTDGILLDSQVLLKDLETDHRSVLQKKGTYETYIEKRIHKIARDLFPRPLILVTTPTSGFDMVNHVSDQERATISEIELRAIQRAQAAGMTNLQTSSLSDSLATDQGVHSGWLYIKTPAEALDLAYYDSFSYAGAIISIDDIFLLIHGLENLGTQNSLPEYDKTTEAFIQGVLQHAQERSIPVILLSKYIPFSEALLEHAVTYQVRSVALPFTSRFEETGQTLEHIQHHNG